jgi:hypothetical protein
MAKFPARCAGPSCGWSDCCYDFGGFSPQPRPFELTKIIELAPVHGMGKPLPIKLPLAHYVDYAQRCKGG